MNYSYLSNLDYNAGIYIRLSQEDKSKLYETDIFCIMHGTSRVVHGM